MGWHLKFHCSGSLSSEAAEPLPLAFMPLDVLMEKNPKPKPNLYMASTPPKLSAFSEGISPNSTVQEFNMQRANRTYFPSICDSIEGLGLSLGVRQSY